MGSESVRTLSQRVKTLEESKDSEGSHETEGGYAGQSTERHGHDADHDHEKIELIPPCQSESESESEAGVGLRHEEEGSTLTPALSWTRDHRNKKKRGGV